jgi:hypothetical protein
VRLEELGHLKNPIILWGIEPATLRVKNINVAIKRYIDFTCDEQAKSVGINGYYA